VDPHALATQDVLQSISSYQSILLRVRTVARLVQDRIDHTIMEYELPLPQGVDTSERRLEGFRD
jgi:hypothetical protein